MAALAYRLSFGIAVALVLASIVLGVLAAQRDGDGAWLPGLPSADPLQVATVSYETSTTDAWVQQMRRYTEIQPRNAFAWQALGLAHKRREEYVPAIVSCKRAIGLGDSSGKCDRALARVYLDVGREAQARFHARRAFERGLRLSPKLRAILADGDAS